MLGIPGLLIQLGCVIASNMLAAKAKSGGEVPPIALAGLFAVGSIVGSILLIIGLCYYAKAKGYSGVLGLLGLLSCIGLIILAVLPDKAKDGNENVS